MTPPPTEYSNADETSASTIWFLYGIPEVYHDEVGTELARTAAPRTTQAWQSWQSQVRGGSEMTDDSGTRRRPLRDFLISLVDAVLSPRSEPSQAQPNDPGNRMVEESASRVEVAQAQQEQPPQRDRRVRAELGRRRRYRGLLFRLALTLIAVLFSIVIVSLIRPQLPGRLAANGVAAWMEFRQAFMVRDGLQERIAITVQSPSVQTRERLINDRFEQVAWAEMLLKSTMQVSPPGATLANESQAASPARNCRASSSRRTASRGTSKSCSCMGRRKSPTCSAST